jgi:hypothetical protein
VNLLYLFSFSGTATADCLRDIPLHLIEIPRMEWIQNFANSVFVRTCYISMCDVTPRVRVVSHLEPNGSVTPQG